MIIYYVWLVVIVGAIEIIHYSEPGELYIKENSKNYLKLCSKDKNKKFKMIENLINS